ncbi:hypothetical protein [Paenibacillus mucilaginosus]|uniref:Uncharacterized protein n=1 Tax=Paenibacillus mucilaginosus (strain KNP414) TaxID=1036673 RepID=F8FEM2_PAEMK|nr:hypothetical protein [Paenibacillus mucilaginosus]AEI45339.1 hypothetical protein KNP414_06820 [Paenibacillus mucilaginosus KNP414]MCG7212780.1 hypothetical protein [Paenibacillus mucilaginosus]WDM26794.1 hypothetical protein KCX80_30975 [Paenibacillus mucilaginosus]
MSKTIVIAALCLMLAAGAAGTQLPGGAPLVPGAPAQEPKPGVEPERPEPAEQGFSIRLEADPRLQAPVRTLVAPRKQTFTLTFAEAMDRASVEAALRKNAEPSGTQPGMAPDSEPVRVKLAYRWQSDRKLQLEVEVLSWKPGPYPVYGYHVDANGARTADGGELRGQPVFETVLQYPASVWKVPVGGGTVVRTGELAEPYAFHGLQAGSRYVLAAKTTGYCECDAPFPRLYSLYDLDKGVMTDLSFRPMASYEGAGDLYADPRGFFYGADAADAAAKELPEGALAKRVAVGGYVHGSGWSKDGTKVLLAVSSAKEQDENLDLVIYDTVNLTVQRLPGVLKGRVEHSQVSDDRIPVTFRDNGSEVRTAMREDEALTEIPYVYSWSTGKVTQWDPPMKEAYSSDYTETDDGRYRLYQNGEVYTREGTLKFQPPVQSSLSFWLAGSHRAVLQEYVETGSGDPVTFHYELKTYDADTNRTSGAFAKLSGQSSLLGTDARGESVYVVSAAAPEPWK